MPIFNFPLIEINKEETRRYAGLAKADFDETKIEEACLEAKLLAQPRSIWNIYEYDSNNYIVIDNKLNKSFKLQGNSIIKHLSNCNKVIILAATVGKEIEQAVTAHFNEGKYSYSMLLDAAATTAVEQITDALEKTIKLEVDRQSLGMKWRFSPGYGDWPIEQQTYLMKFSHANKIGISLTELLMLTPRKSITAIIGLYQKKIDICPQQIQTHDCINCKKLDCIARKQK